MQESPVTYLQLLLMMVTIQCFPYTAFGGWLMFCPDYCVHRVGSSVFGSRVCRIFDIGLIVRLAKTSGASGCPSVRLSLPQRTTPN